MRRDFSRAVSRAEVIVMLCIVAFVVAFSLIPLTSPMRNKSSYRFVCASNLRGIGMGFHIYATDNGSPPRHYFELSSDPINPASHGVSWIGAMGSHESLRISQQTSPSRSPQRNSISRSAFLLITSGQGTPGQFICPESRDREDELRNFGSDATNPAGENAMPGRNRFDFTGYTSMSYGFRLPFTRPPTTTSRPAPLDADPDTVVIAADKGPFLEAGNPAIPDTKTTPDRVSSVAFSAAWQSRTAEELRKLTHEDWSPFNSRNHRGEGQTVLLADGHAEFVRTPIRRSGDNIYTINPNPGDALSAMLGLRPADAPLEGPRISSDSYIVP